MNTPKKIQIDSSPNSAQQGARKRSSFGITDGSLFDGIKTTLGRKSSQSSHIKPTPKKIPDNYLDFLSPNAHEFILQSSFLSNNNQANDKQQYLNNLTDDLTKQLLNTLQLYKELLKESHHTHILSNNNTAHIHLLDFLTNGLAKFVIYTIMTDWKMKDINQNSIQNYYTTVIDILIKFPEMLKQKDKITNKCILHHISNKINIQYGELVLYTIIDNYTDALSIVDSAGSLPLHYLLNNPTLNTPSVVKMVQGYPNSCMAKNSKGQLPLHIALKHPCISIEIVNILLKAAPTSASIPDLKGRLPIHIAMNNKQTTLSIIKILCDAYPDSIRTVAAEGTLPLHILLSQPSPSIEIIQYILQKYPKSCEILCHDNKSPLHIASDNLTPSHEVILLLTQINPNMASLPDSNGYLPCHLAMDQPTPDNNIVETLLKIYPEACEHVTQDGLLPLHFALGVQTEPTTYIIDKLMRLYPKGAVQETIEYLPSQADADPFTWKGEWIEHTWTPLSRAVDREFTNIVKLMTNILTEERIHFSLLPSAGDRRPSSASTQRAPLGSNKVTLITRNPSTFSTTDPTRKASTDAPLSIANQKRRISQDKNTTIKSTSAHDSNGNASDSDDDSYRQGRKDPVVRVRQAVTSPPKSINRSKSPSSFTPLSPIKRAPATQPPDGQNPYIRPVVSPKSSFTPTSLNKPERLETADSTLRSEPSIGELSPYKGLNIEPRHSPLAVNKGFDFNTSGGSGGVVDKHSTEALQAKTSNKSPSSNLLSTRPQGSTTTDDDDGHMPRQTPPKSPPTPSESTTPPVQTRTQRLSNRIIHTSSRSQSRTTSVDSYDTPTATAANGNVSKKESFAINFEEPLSGLSMDARQHLIPSAREEVENDEEDRARLSLLHQKQQQEQSQQEEVIHSTITPLSSVIDLAHMSAVVPSNHAAANSGHSASSDVPTINSKPSRITHAARRHHDTTHKDTTATDIHHTAPTIDSPPKQTNITSGNDKHKSLLADVNDFDADCDGPLGNRRSSLHDKGITPAHHIPITITKHSDDDNWNFHKFDTDIHRVEANNKPSTAPAKRRPGQQSGRDEVVRLMPLEGVDEPSLNPKNKNGSADLAHPPGYGASSPDKDKGTNSRPKRILSATGDHSGEGSISGHSDALTSMLDEQFAMSDPHRSSTGGLSGVGGEDDDNNSLASGTSSAARNKKGPRRHAT